jgi:hypothetical protein
MGSDLTPFRGQKNHSRQSKKAQNSTILRLILQEFIATERPAKQRRESSVPTAISVVRAFRAWAGGDPGKAPYHHGGHGAGGGQIPSLAIIAC